MLEICFWDEKYFCKKVGISSREWDFRNQRPRLAPLKGSELKELGKRVELGEKCGKCGSFRSGFFLRGVWGSGGFRRVRSCVRSRKLLTRASGTRLASRLRRNKFWEKCASRADLDFWESRSWLGFLGGEVVTWIFWGSEARVGIMMVFYRKTILINKNQIFWYFGNFFWGEKIIWQKSQNFESGVRFSESARSTCSPKGVRIKGVSEKELS